MLSLYRRALLLLWAERRVTLALLAANLFVTLVFLIEPLLFGRVINAIAQGREPWDIILLWSLLGAAGIAASVVVSWRADGLAHRRRIAIMTDAFEHTLQLPVAYLASKGTGRMVGVMLTGADALFGIWLSFFREHQVALLAILLLMPLAFLTHPVLAVILLGLAVGYGILSFFVIVRTKTGQAAVERHNQALFGRVGDVVGNVDVVRAFAGPQQERHGLKSVTDGFLAAQMPVLVWWATLTVLTRIGGTATLIAIFAVGSWLVARDQADIGDVVAFVGFATLLIARLDQVASGVQRLFHAAPVLTALFELTDATGMVQESAEARPLQAPIRGRLSFDGVTYRFPGTEIGVFDLDLEVAPGQTIALVGPTGSGKTTTLALMQRLRDPDAGRILIDGQDLRGVTLASLRAAIAVVFQEAGLFNRSIAENLRLARPEATLAEIEAACAQAEALEFIRRKPGGFDFVIGEKGQLLSGGERQRLSIARAILKDAPILLLDEATSALDPLTEAKVKAALDRARAGRTTIVIAHRLQTIRDVDQILVFDQGRVVERGSYESLAAGDGPFSRMVAERSLPSTPTGQTRLPAANAEEVAARLQAAMASLPG